MEKESTSTVLDATLTVLPPSPDRNPSELVILSGSWPSSASDYQLLVSIGTGKFSEVWSGLCRINSSKVAIKVMDLERMSSTFEDILQEVQIMRLCDDANILSCFCSFVHDDQLWMISQLMDKGSCQRILTVARQLGVAEGFNEDCIGYILCEAMKGVNYLHEKGHVHKDIKPGNILIDSTANVKLSDFGVSGWIVGSGQQTNSKEMSTNSLLHMAPEILEQSAHFDNRADIWSIGITALELAKGCLPFPESTDVHTLKSLIEEEPPSLKSYSSDKQHLNSVPFSKFYEDFYKKCLQKNPKLRPSAAELMKHKLLRGRSRDPLINFIMAIPSFSPNDSNFMVSSQAHPENDISVRESEDSSSFAPGTSWVFDGDLIPQPVDKNGKVEKKV